MGGLDVCVCVCVIPDNMPSLLLGMAPRSGVCCCWFYCGTRMPWAVFGGTLGAVASILYKWAMLVRRHNVTPRCSSMERDNLLMLLAVVVILGVPTMMFPELVQVLRGRCLCGCHLMEVRWLLDAGA